jgi:translation initiation factor IF-2
MSRLRKHLSKKKTQTDGTENNETSAPKTRPSSNTPNQRKATRIRRNRTTESEAIPVEKNTIPLNAVVPTEASEETVESVEVIETAEISPEMAHIETEVEEVETEAAVEIPVVEEVAEEEPPKQEVKPVESGNRTHAAPTVHAAPASARTKNDKTAKLGSAVITPPPNYGAGGPPAPTTTDTAGRRGDRNKSWNAEEEDRKDKTKSPKEKRNRRNRQRDWNANDSFGDGNSNRTNRQFRRKKGKIKASPKAKAIKRRVMIDGSITVSELAHGISEKSGSVIKVLLGMGEMATINDSLDFEIASLVVAEFDYEAVDTSFQEDKFLIATEEEQQEEGELRPPVVTIMGHVDHGKTTLLDTIRKANVAGGEAGGITQHTSAYQVAHQNQLITFIDTPGHEAFTAMRARGAQVTDIVILVVAADDGPMPQTIEALNHARASGVQLMVAVNKCDKPGANPDKVRQDFMRYELVAEDYGGDTIFVNVSALNGEGIEDLLENIILLSEMGEYRAPVDRHADGFVLEARLEKGRGIVANLLVKTGTLKQGDTLVLGNVWGRVRAMYDHKGKKIKQALPSSPIELIGLQEVPEAGDDFVVVKKPKDAKALVQHRLEQARKIADSSKTPVSLEEIVRRQVEGEPVKLNLIIKSDVGGTLEAIQASIGQIEVTGTEINVLHAAIGGITESDVSLAHTYEGIIIGFNVRPDAKARRVVNQTNVEVRTYSVIYEALEDLENGLKGLLEPELKEQWKGSAEIRETFSVPKVGTVAGCFVLDGKIARKHQIRLLRDGTIVWEGKLASLRRFKDDVREVEKGYECGINLDGFNDIKVGDQLETFMMEEEEQD